MARTTSVGLGTLIAAPITAVAMVVLILAGAGTQPPPHTGCGGGGTGQRIGDVDLDPDQMAHARTIITTTARRQLPPYAAVIAVTTAYTEARLRNSPVMTDHDSQGLFQQRVSLYGSDVALDPVRSTTAFLDKLVAIPTWEQNPVGYNAQAVQISAYPERYQPNAALGEDLVGMFWPAASAAAATPAPPGAGPGISLATGSSPAICIAGEVAGSIVGPTGGTTSGVTTVPPGLVINGSPQGVRAVQFALAQLRKPYVWGAAGPDSYDCSGLTMAAWAAGGVALPHFTLAQLTQGTPSPTTLSQAVAGDLVFIPGALGTAAAPRHVGMIAGYVDAPDGRHLYLVQAPQSGLPVMLTETTRWAGQIVAVRHIA